MKIVISSGHGKYIRGASGSPVPPYLDEVNEARRVVDRVAAVMRDMGNDVTTFHDDVSTTQSENLNRIVNFHNSKTRDLDVSVHFNAFEKTNGPMGSEVLYVTQGELADQVVDKLCNDVGFTNRGAKYRGDLAFLNNTEEPAILIETCFVDSLADAELYDAEFEAVCVALAEGITDEAYDASEPAPEPPSGALFTAKGTCSTFGGPGDTGVSPSEGLAFIYNFGEAPYLFLPQQPPGTTGLARRLDTSVFYVACRWNYDVTPKTMLRDSGQMALVRAKRTGIARLAHPADWGPHEEQTGRAADLSDALMASLRITTDDEVEVVYPWEAQL